jgi:hypothetical protein
VHIILSLSLSLLFFLFYMFLKSQFLLTFFNRKSRKSAEKQEKKSSISPPHAQQQQPIINQEEEQRDNNETQKPTAFHVSAAAAAAAAAAAIPQVEFEESRLLLQELNDEFSSGTSTTQLASFPKFDYLLLKSQPAIEKEAAKVVEKKPSSRKLSATLRHRISLYRPTNKTMKRTLSTPDLYRQ